LFDALKNSGLKSPNLELLLFQYWIIDSKWDDVIVVKKY
jgi:hypothetical protein